MPHTLKVTIDPDRCVGYGRCAAIAPGTFVIEQDTNKAELDDEGFQQATSHSIFAAARACPTQAIVVEQFGRRMYPQVIAPMPADIQRQLREAAEDAGTE
jgi:ferredoxin